MGAKGKPLVATEGPGQDDGERECSRHTDCTACCTFCGTPVMRGRVRDDAPITMLELTQEPNDSPRWRRHFCPIPEMPLAPDERWFASHTEHLRTLTAAAPGESRPRLTVVKKPTPAVPSARPPRPAWEGVRVG